MNGTVNPKGVDTHYYFQYGETTEYGSSTPPIDAGSGARTLGGNTNFPMAGEPAVVQTANGSQYVYYGGADGQLFFWLWNASNESWTLNWEESTHLM